MIQNCARSILLHTMQIELCDYIINQSEQATHEQTKCAKLLEMASQIYQKPLNTNNYNLF